MGHPPLLPFNEPTKEPAVPDALPFKFVDLFAGIGGFRTALTKLGVTRVFSSEWDRPKDIQSVVGRHAGGRHPHEHRYEVFDEVI